ncbi:MAG: hypothetical protein AVDCRST_MAG05-4608, partial [uncultured Rubrobacteraceae bacterium]
WSSPPSSTRKMAVSFLPLTLSMLPGRSHPSAARIAIGCRATSSIPTPAAAQLPRTPSARRSGC